MPFGSKTSSIPQVLLMKSPAKLEVMFLNVGIAFIVHLSSHIPTTNFENRRSSEVCNTDFAVQEPVLSQFCGAVD